MQVFIAVIDDLWRFATSSLFGYRTATALDREREHQSAFGMVPVSDPGPIQESLLEVPAEVRERTDFKIGERYFIGEAGVFAYSDPVVAFDTSVKEFAYGDAVILKKIGGRWAEVAFENQDVWVLKDVLIQDRVNIFPRFVTDEVYDAHHLETIKLRNLIQDEFSGGLAGLPLQSAEYIWYRLQSLGIQVEWKNIAPRVPGTWQQQLRGITGVYMNVLPKTHAAMEYIVDDQYRLAFVDAVFPDHSIKISQIGHSEEGVFRETIVSQDLYRELQPVFISIN